jgi:hypothetical protein
MLEKRRNPSPSDVPLPPPGGSPLPYGRRRDDAETAHFRKWVALADAALEKEPNQSVNERLMGNKTSDRPNVAKVFEIFFGPKRRRSTGNRAFRDNLLI